MLVPDLKAALPYFPSVPTWVWYGGQHRGGGGGGGIEVSVGGEVPKPAISTLVGPKIGHKKLVARREEPFKPPERGRPVGKQETQHWAPIWCSPFPPVFDCFGVPS